MTRARAAKERARDGATVVAMLAVAITVLSLGYHRPRLCLAVIGAIVLVALWRWRTRGDVVLGLTGVALGPAAEWCATHAGLWRYAYPELAGLPFWTLPMWWMFPVAVVRLTGAVVGAVARDDPYGGGGGAAPRGAGHALVFALGSVAWLCAFGVARPMLAFAGTLALLAAWVHRRHAAADVAVLVLCGAIGPGVELIPVRLGAWGYPDGPLFGLPLWLPTGYGVFGAALVELGRALGHRVAPQTAARPRAA